MESPNQTGPHVDQHWCQTISWSMLQGCVKVHFFQTRHITGFSITWWVPFLLITLTMSSPPGTGALLRAVDTIHGYMAVPIGYEYPYSKWGKMVGKQLLGYCPKGTLKGITRESMYIPYHVRGNNKNYMNGKDFKANQKKHWEFRWGLLGNQPTFRKVLEGYSHCFRTPPSHREWSLTCRADPMKMVAQLSLQGHLDLEGVHGWNFQAVLPPCFSVVIFLQVIPFTWGLAIWKPHKGYKPAHVKILFLKTFLTGWNYELVRLGWIYLPGCQWQGYHPKIHLSRWCS